MSQYYSMSVNITKSDPSKIDSIKKAAKSEWGAFGNWFSVGSDGWMSEGEGSLHGGEGEAAFVHRLTRAIWLANESFCEVEIVATYLESRPYEEYTFDEDNYDRLMTTS